MLKASNPPWGETIMDPNNHLKLRDWNDVRWTEPSPLQILNPIQWLRPRHTQSEDYASKVRSYLILCEWERRLWCIRFAEDQAVYIWYEEVIHSIPHDGQCALQKTIIRSSQSKQSEIRGEVYGKISPNATLTFNFHLDKRKSDMISLVRLSKCKRFWKALCFCCVLSKDAFSLKMVEMWCCAAPWCRHRLVHPNPEDEFAHFSAGQ